MGYKITPMLAWILFMVSCAPTPKDNPGDLPTDDNTTESLPNIVFLLIDDIGISSIPYYGNAVDSTTGWTSQSANGADSMEYAMPNLAAFGQEARVYTNMYATALCAPSRGALITGRYPFRNGIVYPQWGINESAAGYQPNNYDSNNSITTAQGYLDTNQVGYPEVLRAMGYTTAFGGKWNLRYGQNMCAMDGRINGDEINSSDSANYMDAIVPAQAAHLNAMGFDQTFGPVALVGNTIDYYPPQLQNAGNAEQQYLSDSLLKWMKNTLLEGRAAKQPQYIHYCFGLIHDPYGSSCNEYGYSPPPSDSGDSDQNHVWADKADEVDRLIGAFVHMIDSVDSVYGTQTLIIIAGDNGTEDTYYSQYQDTWVQGGKSSNTTNGSRVPFMVRWPGMVDTGMVDVLVDFTDVFPTMVDLVGGEDALDSLVGAGNQNYQPCYKGGANSTMDSLSYVIDGQSFLYEMTGGRTGTQLSPRQAVYAQYNGTALLANQDYKLGISSDVGFYKINDATLVDSAITGTAYIKAIGDKAAANPFDEGTAYYNNYDSLVGYYNAIFPAAASQ